MSALTIGSIVRYTTAFCEQFQLDYDDANELAIVRQIKPPLKAGSKLLPARAVLCWEDGRESTAFINKLEVYRGAPSIAAKEQWGIF